MADDITQGQVETIEPTPTPTPLVNELDILNVSGLTVSGTITGVDIVGTTITGGTFQTATTGQRVVLNSTTNSIDFYDSTNTKVGDIYGSTSQIYINTDDVLLGSAFGVFVDVSQVTSNVTIAANTLPNVDGVYELGNDTSRWGYIRGVVITPGDLAWEETNCYICNKEFSKGDKLTMVVKDMVTKNGETLTHTVPICKPCFLAD